MESAYSSLEEYKQETKEEAEQEVKQKAKQGIEQEKIQIAKNMLKRNIDIKLVSEITNISIKQINALKNQI